MTNVSAASGRVRSDDLRALIPIRSRPLVTVEERRRAAVEMDARRCRRGASDSAWSNGVDPFLDPTLAGSGRLPSATKRWAMVYEAVSTSDGEGRATWSLRRCRVGWSGLVCEGNCARVRAGWSASGCGADPVELGLRP